MIDNVTSINKNGDIIAPTNQPNPFLIKFLEDQLERARAGEIIGIAGAILDKDKLGEFFTAGRVGGFSMIGALHCAVHDLHRTARGEKP